MADDSWVRYDIPGSERPWFHRNPCPLDDVTEPHLHARNEDGSWGVTILTFAQLGVEAPTGGPTT